MDSVSFARADVLALVRERLNVDEDEEDTYDDGAELDAGQVLDLLLRYAKKAVDKTKGNKDSTANDAGKASKGKKGKARGRSVLVETFPLVCLCSLRLVLCSFCALSSSFSVLISCLLSGLNAWMFRSAS